MIEWLFNRGNFMKINRDKRKIFPMILIFLIVFLFAIMINNKVYGSYGEQFWKFLVTREDSYNVSSNGETTEKKYTVIVNGKTSATVDNKTFEIPYALDFSSITEFVNSNCTNKDGQIDNSKVDKVFTNYFNEYSDEGNKKAMGNTEINNYNNLFGILGRVKVVIMNRKSLSGESLEDALKRDGIISEVYNSDGTVNKEESSNSSPTKEDFLNYTYSDIKNYLNDSNNVYWGGSKGDEKKYKGIDDNSNLSESDKSEIRNKWAKVYADANATDPNIEDYLKTEIKAYKAERYYRDPNVTTSTTDAGVDDVISDGDSFIGLGKEDRIDVSNLRTFSRNIYNILLTIGIAVAVISGSIIGIKYMLGSVEEKADIKSLLIPYIAGCVIIFGSFAIWKLVVTILQGV